MPSIRESVHGKSGIVESRSGGAIVSAKVPVRLQNDHLVIGARTTRQSIPTSIRRQGPVEPGANCIIDAAQGDAVNGNVVRAVGEVGTAVNLTGDGRGRSLQTAVVCLTAGVPNRQCRPIRQVISLRRCYPNAGIVLLARRHQLVAVIEGKITVSAVCDRFGIRTHATIAPVPEL